MRIKLRRLKPHAHFSLRANEPEFGMIVTTTPADAKVVVKNSGNLLEIENLTDEPVERVVIRAKFPVSIAWVVLSIVSLIGTLIALIELNWTPTPSQSRVASDATN